MMTLLRKSPRTPDYKRPPLRQSNGCHSPRERYSYDGDYSRKKSATYAKRICSILVYTALITTILISLSTAVLYVNCSNVAGFEIIPKSHQLCHDLYQFMQTGRFTPLTWDYKASLNESVHIAHEALSSVIDWFKNLNMVTLKEDLIASVFAVRDSIVGFPKWVYENSGQVGRLVWHLILKWSRAVANYIVFGLHYIANSASGAFEWIRVSSVDTFNKIPTYWEKVKNGWN